MNDIVYTQGVKATVRQSNFKFFAIAVLAIVSFVFSACNSTSSGPSVGTEPKPDDAAATVNGKTIKMEEVERAIKQEGQGLETTLSPLQLADARLRILNNLIQQEVMFQKAEKEGSVPKEEDVTAEFNKLKQASGLSQERFDEEMKKAGQTEPSVREGIKKQLAVKTLIDKISSKVEPPKDSEVEAFFNGNKEAYIKKRGVKLAAIVVDPANNGEGDTTTDEQSAVIKGNEIIKQLQAGADFATVAREKSEDNSRIQGGDLGNISEEQMKQTFPPQVVATLMDPKFQVGQILPTPMQGKFYIFKLQERNDREEARTLETPGVRQDVINSLIEARKQLLAVSYQTIAMNEAKIENYLAKQVVENPNALSGARPAGAANASPANTGTNTNVTTNTNTNVNGSANTNSAANVATPVAKPSVAPTANANVKR